jgi:HTH-type transcriptional regulator/antitoxin HigA
MAARKGTREYEERDVLAVLIERYESEKYPISAPDPVEAIKFRMEQQGLTRRDLEPYLGGKSKVSEVLTRKRDLTLAQIRALHSHLGIPAEVLIRRPPDPLPEVLEQAIARLPLLEMQKKGAFRGLGFDTVKGREEEAVRWLHERAGSFDKSFAVGFRQNATMRISVKTDRHALLAWCLLSLGEARSNPATKQAGGVPLTIDSARTLVALSALEDGPRQAQIRLSKMGVSMVIVPHLKRTYLDGAAFVQPDGSAVIALTLRYDRTDNFWFVLMHEIAHLALGHLSKKSPWIADNLDLPGGRSNRETEADEFARKALLPEDFELHRNRQLSTAGILEYAARKGIHPAIVAGRVQFERNNYRTFARLVGRDEVRRLFNATGEE